MYVRERETDARVSGKNCVFGARAVVSLLLLCVDNGVDARMVTSVPFFGGVLALVMVVFLNVRLAFEKTGEGLQVDD